MSPLVPGLGGTPSPAIAGRRGNRVKRPSRGDRRHGWGATPQGSVSLEERSPPGATAIAALGASTAGTEPPMLLQMGDKVAYRKEMTWVVGTIAAMEGVRARVAKGIALPWNWNPPRSFCSSKSIASPLQSQPPSPYLPLPGLAQRLIRPTVTGMVSATSRVKRNTWRDRLPSSGS